ncbi:MAG: DNA double-strand break repair nuclease NurA [Candidatus Bathyarchaeota archaeon]|nr:DNA double-strand break repair nuclease NurA [Candidatus Bathyarchaeota archaeon]
MIKQHSIAITQKYNFPKQNIDSTLPERFFEQSLYSLNRLNQQPFQLNQHVFQKIFDKNNCTSKLQLRSNPIKLIPICKNTTIGAVDTSTIKIGETRKGILIAIRGAIIQRQNKKYRYTRVGPFIFHITERNRNQIYNELERACFRTHIERQSNKPNLLQLPMYIASLLERWLKDSLVKRIKNGLILFDGSLVSGTIDSPLYYMKHILNQAKKNDSTILAFSKITKLRSNGYLITERLPRYDPPYILETNGVSAKLPIVLLGDIYVAKLNKTNYAFRLDIDKDLTFQVRKKAVERLLGNDFLIHGYPETLRLAHVLCTFTANEIVAVKHFLTSKHGIRIINRPDMHKILFGPFGKGEKC